MKRVVTRGFQAATLVVILSCGTLVGRAQFSRPNTPLSGNSPPPDPLGPAARTPDIPTVDPEIERALLKQRHIEAYKRMHKDAKALGELASELKAELDPATPSRQNLSQALSKAKKIDKLAGEIDRLMRQD